MLIDFPICKIFCTYQMNNGFNFFSLITTLLTIKHLVMEPLLILGHLFGTNFLPELEIRSSQNITVFKSKKKKHLL